MKRKRQAPGNAAFTHAVHEAMREAPSASVSDIVRCVQEKHPEYKRTNQAMLRSKVQGMVDAKAAAEAAAMPPVAAAPAPASMNSRLYGGGSAAVAAAAAAERDGGNSSASAADGASSESHAARRAKRRAKKAAKSARKGASGEGSATTAGVLVKANARPAERLCDLAGVDSILQDVREIIEYPMRHPELYSHLGVEPPCGVLLHGPPGCGKTHLAHALAGELGCTFISKSAPEIVTGQSGKSEEILREIFRQARAQAPCIIFIDEIDAIAPKREETQHGMERRIVAQLLTCMDGLRRRVVEVAQGRGALDCERHFAAL